MLPRSSSRLRLNVEAHTTRPTVSSLPISRANDTASSKSCTESLSRIQHDVLGDSSERGLCTLSLMAFNIDNYDNWLTSSWTDSRNSTSF
eukprot:IDg23379t1